MQQSQSLSQNTFLAKHGEQEAVKHDLTELGIAELILGTRPYCDERV